MAPPTDTGPDEGQEENHSLLFKAAFFVLNSRYFPLMVRAACARVGAEYSQEVVEQAAVDTRVQNHTPLPAGEPDPDGAILSLAADQKKAISLDWAITAAVADATGMPMPGQKKGEA